MEVKGGRADKGIREGNLPAIFCTFVAPRHRNSHAQTHANIRKFRNVLALVTANSHCQRAACFLRGFA